jgi:spore germination protein KB
MLLVGLYSALSKRYPGLSLIDINTVVFGSILGKGITVLYVFYFLSLSYLNTRDLGDFIQSTVLPNTPMAIMLVSFVAVCAMAVKKGPVVITRCGFLVTAIAISVILLNTALLLNIMQPRHLLPAFQLPVGNYLIGTLNVTMLPFCEIMAFFMLIPPWINRRHSGRQ